MAVGAVELVVHCQGEEKIKAHQIAHWHWCCSSICKKSSAQPPMVICKMEAQLEYLRIAYQVFTGLAPTCMLSRCFVAKFLHRSSGGSLLRVCCWLGKRDTICQLAAAIFEGFFNDFFVEQKNSKEVFYFQSTPRYWRDMQSGAKKRKNWLQLGGFFSQPTIIFFWERFFCCCVQYVH